MFEYKVYGLVSKKAVLLKVRILCGKNSTLLSLDLRSRHLEENTV